jgi:hypothetical protein
MSEAPRALRHSAGRRRLGSVARAAGAAALLGLALSLPAGCRTVTGEPVFLADVPEPAEALDWARNRYDPDKRRTALKWFAHAPWAGGEVYLEIYRALVEDPDPTVRQAALVALGRHGKPADASLVALRLDLDPNAGVRLQAARTLQRLHHDDAVEPLLEALAEDADSWVRAAAAKALGQYPRADVLLALIEALDDEKLEVAAGARRSLVYLTGEDYRYDTIGWFAWAKQVEQPFAQQRLFVYETFWRAQRWYEFILPFLGPPNEAPGVPHGILQAAGETPGEGEAAETGEASPAEG